LILSQQCISAAMKVNHIHNCISTRIASILGESYYSPLLSTCEAISKMSFTGILCPILGFSIGERKTNWKKSRGSHPLWLVDCGTLHELRLRELGLFAS